MSDVPSRTDELPGPLLERWSASPVEASAGFVPDALDTETIDEGMAIDPDGGA